MGFAWKKKNHLGLNVMNITNGLYQNCVYLAVCSIGGCTQYLFNKASQCFLFSPLLFILVLDRVLWLNNRRRGELSAAEMTLTTMARQFTDMKERYQRQDEGREESRLKISKTKEIPISGLSGVIGGGSRKRLCTSAASYLVRWVNYGNYWGRPRSVVIWRVIR